MHTSRTMSTATDTRRQRSWAASQLSRTTWNVSCRSPGTISVSLTRVPFHWLSASLDRLVSATPNDAFTLSSTLGQHQLLKRKGENISRLYTVSCIICIIAWSKGGERNYFVVLSSSPQMCLCFRCWAFCYVVLGVYPYEYIHEFNDSIWRDAAPVEGEHILLPWPKKKNHDQLPSSRFAARRTLFHVWYHARSGAISAGQVRSATVRDFCPALIAPDRAWYHTWNSVLLAANLEDGSFFLARVVD